MCQSCPVPVDTATPLTRSRRSQAHGFPLLWSAPTVWRLTLADAQRALELRADTTAADFRLYTSP